MNFDNKEIPETRTVIGNVQSYTSSGAFCEEYTPRSEKKNTQMRISYISTVPGLIKTNTEDYNFSFGAITIPSKGVFKRFDFNNIDLRISDKFSLIPDFNLNIKNDSTKPRLYMVMYSFSFSSRNDIVFESKMMVNKNPENSTVTNLGSVTEVGVHNGRVFSLPPGDNKIEIQYKYSGESLSISNTDNDNFVQSIYGFGFPEDTVIHNFKLEKSLNLNTNKEWKAMGIDGKFDIAIKKTALIICHINIMTKGKLFKARIRINNKFNKKSVILTEGLNYAYTQSYSVKVLQPGSYNLDIEFSSLSTNTFNPELEDINSESVFIQVVLLD